MVTDRKIELGSSVGSSTGVDGGQGKPCLVEFGEFSRTVDQIQDDIGKRAKEARYYYNECFSEMKKLKEMDSNYHLLEGFTNKFNVIQGKWDVVDQVMSLSGKSNGKVEKRDDYQQFWKLVMAKVKWYGGAAAVVPVVSHFFVWPSELLLGMVFLWNFSRDVYREFKSWKAIEVNGARGVVKNVIQEEVQKIEAESNGKKLSIEELMAKRLDHLNDLQEFKVKVTTTLSHYATLQKDLVREQFDSAAANVGNRYRALLKVSNYFSCFESEDINFKKKKEENVVNEDGKGTVMNLIKQEVIILGRELLAYYLGLVIVVKAMVTFFPILHPGRY